MTLLLDNGSQLTEYYSRTTSLKVRQVRMKQTAEGVITVTTGFKDFRPEGGILFPTSLSKRPV